jgi:CheY-like chemotaxis protein
MASSRQIRVLIVDDEPTVVDALNEATTQFGHQTAVALNGAQALRAVREFAPHVVLLDIQMPGIDGFTLLEHLKRSPQPPAIIIVSGNADEQDARQLLERGAVDYVMKPVDLNYLKQAIAAAAGSALP